MQIVIPTTKAEMYDALQDIFYYYRIKKEPYEGLVLDELDLGRMEYVSLTDEEITAKAQTLVMPEHKKRVADYKEKLNDALAALNKRAAAAEESAAKRVTEITERYDALEAKAQAEAADKGIANSSILLDRLTEIENERTAALAAAAESADAEAEEIQAEIDVTEEKLLTADDYCQEVFAAEVNAKCIELKDKQAELEREIFKYNNGIEEKEQRYSNTIKQTNANLAIKYQEVNSTFFTKDQLVEMGYYEDVINCVCAYYDTLTATAAFNDMKEESKLCIYLEDYYDSVLYMYKTRAGA